MKRITVLIALAALCLIVGQTARAGETSWPSQPVQIYAGANPGGGIDTAARLLGKYLEKELGVPFVVSNMAGGAGSLASRQVQKSKADGYTMMVCHESLLTNKISGITDFDYDGFDIGGINIKVYTNCLLSRKYKTFDEMIEAARKEPGRLRFGTDIAGANDTAVIAMIEEVKGVQFQLIDAGAVSDQIPALMGDHIEFMKAPLGLVKDYVTSGEFHLIGFFNEERHPKFPDTPTMKELGVDYIIDKFFGCFFTKGTPKEVLAKFDQAMQKLARDPGFIADADRVEYTVDYVPQAEVPAYLEACKRRFDEYQKLMDNR